MGRIGIIVAATLIAGGFGTQQVYAQSDSASQKNEKAEKKKAEKKNTAQSGTQTVPGPAPMSGYRPDSLSNY